MPALFVVNPSCIYVVDQIGQKFNAPDEKKPKQNNTLNEQQINSTKTERIRRQTN